MPLDPSANPASRAWLPCPNCQHGKDCAVCRAGRTCSDHWQYLLANRGLTVHLQCPGCLHLWSYTPNRLFRVS